MDRIRLAESALQNHKHPVRGFGWRHNNSISHLDLATSCASAASGLNRWPPITSGGHHPFPKNQLRHSRSLDYNHIDRCKDGLDTTEYYWHLDASVDDPDFLYSYRNNHIHSFNEVDDEDDEEHDNDVGDHRDRDRDHDKQDQRHTDNGNVYNNDEHNEHSNNGKRRSIRDLEDNDIDIDVEEDDVDNDHDDDDGEDDSAIDDDKRFLEQRFDGTPPSSSTALKYVSERQQSYRNHKGHPLYHQHHHHHHKRSSHYSDFNYGKCILEHMYHYLYPFYRRIYSVSCLYWFGV